MSVLGEGSRFWFETPCAPVAPPTPAKSALAALCASSDLEGLRAMIVDDNAVNRELVRIILTPWSFTSSVIDEQERRRSH